MRTQYVICLTLFLFATVTRAQERTDPGLKCLQVDMTLPGSDADTGPRITNNCGKDITAFRVVFHDSAGTEVGAANREMLGLLALSPPSPDIFRKNTSRGFPEVSFGGSALPSVVAIAFADRSTLGEPAQVASLITSRTKGLEDFQKRLKVLDSVSDWNDALELRERAEEARARKDYTLAGFIDVLAQEQERSNVSSWAASVADRRKTLLRVIEIFEFHLGKRAELSGDSR